MCKGIIYMAWVIRNQICWLQVGWTLARERDWLCLSITWASHHGGSNHQQLLCLTNNLFGIVKKKKALSSASLTLCEGNRPMLMDSLYQWSVIWKPFSCHEVIRLTACATVIRLQENGFLFMPGFQSCLCQLNVTGTLPIIYSDVIMVAMASQITSLLNQFTQPFIRRISKKTSKLRPTHWPLCREFAQRASNAENVSIWWRHQVEITSRFQGTGNKHYVGMNGYDECVIWYFIILCYVVLGYDMICHVGMSKQNTEKTESHV